MYNLRPYQQEALAAIGEGHKSNDSVLLELPTGTGKTVVLCRYASSWEHGRTMVIAPFLPLISQAASKICKETGIFPAIEQADQRSNESCEALRNPYIVASKQTLTGKSQRYKRFKDIGLVICDEAHYCLTEIYAEMLDWFRDQGAKILGVTATPKRHDNKAMGQVFDDCVYQYGIVEAVSDGWLVPIRVNVMQIEHMDLSEIGTKTGFNGERDFVQSQLNDLLEDTTMVYEVAEATAKATLGKKTAIYCSSVNQACAVANVLRDQYDIKADWICADKQRCSDNRLRETMASFTGDQEGVTHLCNVGMLTTGWDFPGLECIVNARPTRSLSLYTQIMGRLTRPCELNGLPVVEGLADAEERREAISGSLKPHGLVIDLVDASLEHKLITAADVLGGKWTLAERQRVVEKAADEKEAVDLDTLIEETRREEEERIRAEMARRKVEQARYREIDVDPYGGRRSNSGKVASRVIIPPTEKQMKFLRWKFGSEIDQYQISKAQASRMIGQFMKGMSKQKVKATNRLRTAQSAAPKQLSLEDVNAELLMM